MERTRGAAPSDRRVQRRTDRGDWQRGARRARGPTSGDGRQRAASARSGHSACVHRPLRATPERIDGPRGTLCRTDLRDPSCDRIRVRSGDTAVSRRTHRVSAQQEPRESRLERRGVEPTGRRVLRALGGRQDGRRSSCHLPQRSPGRTRRGSRCLDRSRFPWAGARGGGDCGVGFPAGHDRPASVLQYVYREPLISTRSRAARTECYRMDVAAFRSTDLVSRLCRRVQRYDDFNLRTQPGRDRRESYAAFALSSSLDLTERLTVWSAPSTFMPNFMYGCPSSLASLTL